MVKVNFANTQEFSPLPRGKYHWEITDYEVGETSDQSKHPGAEKWSLECTVADGPQEGRTQRLNIFLPPYEPKALKTLLRCTVGQHQWSDEDLDSGDFEVEPENLLELHFVATVRPQKDNPEFNDMGIPQPYDEETWEPEGGASASDLP